MKIGLLADIHANAYALEAVLSSAKKNGVDRLLIAGDLFGYYFQPKKVLDMISDWNADMILGNHDIMLSEVRKDPSKLRKIEKKYGSGLRIALDELSKEDLIKLDALSDTANFNFSGTNILLCHGSPWDINCYIYPDANQSDFEKFSLVNSDIIIMGHTHYPLIKKINNKILINPGSVGQPRNKVCGAHWAILNTTTHQLEFRVEDYDPKLLIDECVLRHPDIPYLSEVIRRS